MARQGFSSSDVVDFPPASFTAVANTVTETNLWTVGLWSTIPAFDLRAGKMYVVRAGGILSTTVTPTVVWTARYGTSATSTSNISIGASTAVATGSGLVNVPWHAEFVLGCRQVGVAAAGATVTGNGFAVLGNVAAAAAQVATFGSTIPTTVDQTIQGGICITLTWGTASASNTATCQWANLQSLN